MTAKKKNKKQGKKRSDIRQILLKLLNENPQKEFNVKQIAHRLGLVKMKEKAVLQELLDFMSQQGMVLEPAPWKYMAAPETEKFLSGSIDITPFGYGFVNCPHLQEDVFIPPNKTGHALHGDTVKITLRKNPSGKKVEGEVVEVISRNRKHFVGMLEFSENFAFFLPDNPKIHIDFFIPIKKTMDAKKGDKVIAELNDWPAHTKNPFAKVIRVLGPAGLHEVEMHAIIEEFALPYEFPPAILAEAESIPVEIKENEIKKRRDFREVPTFTIDPFDAKDFDDAISVQKKDDKLWEIGVHIADVTHYLKERSDLNKEAERRATSVYLVDRVIPMLPEKLSNFLCSLRPQEDKLCFSAVFAMNNEGDVLNEWFGRTIIHSSQRFTYEEVQEILEGKDHPLKKELLIADTVAKKLREKRFANGSFSFETEEVKFLLNEKGKTLAIEKKVRKEAHMLIEDLMLLANRKVAEYIKKHGKDKHTGVYRIHEAPGQEKLDNFERIAKQFGYQIDRSNSKALAHSFNILLHDIEGKPEQNFLQALAIRAMAKARYTTDEEGHYGLAFEHYTHFTSPIRRFPDVLVHRILADCIEKRTAGYDAEELEKLCKHASEREINAENAERASIKYKQVEFMQDKIGQEFEGLISGVIEKGIFVEIIENKCEGMIPMDSLRDDYYLYEEENYLLKGYNSGRVFKLGQIIRIRVVKADLPKRTLEFHWVEDTPE
jgi:ribonuclease R